MVKRRRQPTNKKISNYYIMDIINCIDLFYGNDILKISKFEIYKILKQVHERYTYYKLKKTFNKLISTGIIVKTNGKNMYIFNRVRKKPKPSLTVYFD